MCLIRINRRGEGGIPYLPTVLGNNVLRFKFFFTTERGEGGIPYLPIVLGNYILRFKFFFTTERGEGWVSYLPIFLGNCVLRFKFFFTTERGEGWVSYLPIFLGNYVLRFKFFFTTEVTEDTERDWQSSVVLSVTSVISVVKIFFTLLNTETETYKLLKMSNVQKSYFKSEGKVGFHTFQSS